MDTSDMSVYNEYTSLNLYIKVAHCGSCDLPSLCILGAFTQEETQPCLTAILSVRREEAHETARKVIPAYLKSNYTVMIARAMSSPSSLPPSTGGPRSIPYSFPTDAPAIANLKALNINSYIRLCQNWWQT